jgi:hypothetical protein
MLDYLFRIQETLTGRNFTILLRVVSRVHHMNTGILSDFYEEMTNRVNTYGNTFGLRCLGFITPRDRSEISCI